ncbi:MAG: ABC transporter permease subunit, partial [Methanobacteriota archaeon]
TVSDLAWVDETANVGLAPSHRAGCAMTYDSGVGLMVLFGGSAGGAETWTYDVTARVWSPEPTIGPTWRTGHAMTYDADNGTVVLFGGTDGGRETWTYNVTSDTWNMTTNTTGPSARYGHSMAYDESTKVVVLVGGNDGRDETWTYDVVTNAWTEVIPPIGLPSPSGRDGHAVVYDSDTQTIRLFGGNDREFSRMWYRELNPGTPVIMAGFPLNEPTNPYYSPALTQDGSRIFVNDGKLRALHAVNGTDAWPYSSLQINPNGIDWTNPPVVALPSEIGGVFNVEVVYATSNDGWIYARYSENGTVPPDWDELNFINVDNPTEGGCPLRISAIVEDEGVLTVPDFYGEDIFVGSSSGYLYKIRRDTAHGLFACSNSFLYHDQGFINQGFGFVGGVRFVREKFLLFAIGNEDRQTPGDPTDDRGTLFVVGIDGNLSWRKSFDGHIFGTPTIWKDEAGTHATPSIWFATDRGYVQSYSSTGLNMAPLPPGCYESGNCYALGTDSQGRDIFSQLMWGSQIALTVGLLAAAGSIGIGVVIGLVAGYSGGRIDTVLMRFTDVILVLPGLPFIIILAAVLGPSYWNIIFVLTIIGWPGTARVIRSEVLSLKERPFIDSARVTGASNIRIMFKHLAPNVLPLAFLYMTLAVSGAILSEAALSFLGLGDVNTASWGQMLHAIQFGNVLKAWWWLVPPGLAITFISLAFYLIGRAFEQIVNPRLRKR